jgi:hypothetical protein
VNRLIILLLQLAAALGTGRNSVQDCFDSATRCDCASVPNLLSAQFSVGNQGGRGSCHHHAALPAFDKMPSRCGVPSSCRRIYTHSDQGQICLGGDCRNHRQCVGQIVSLSTTRRTVASACSARRNGVCTWTKPDGMVDARIVKSHAALERERMIPATGGFVERPLPIHFLPWCIRC